MKPLTSFQLEQLQIIYDAYDRIYDIASHRWHAFHYYDREYKVSNLFGHYVRSLPEFRDTDPAAIPTRIFMVRAAPLVAAINEILRLIIVDDPDGADIQAISEGRALIFRVASPYHRCMAVFRLIESAYPRDQYRDKSPRLRKPTHRSARTAEPKWLPYKEN